MATRTRASAAKEGRQPLLLSEKSAGFRSPLIRVRLMVAHTRMHLSDFVLPYGVRRRRRPNDNACGGIDTMTQDYRIEKDSLGEMQVPAGALYGAQTQRAVLNFPVSGMRPYPAFVWAQAMIKRAAAEVNRDLGLLDARLAAAIVQAAQEVIDGQWQDQFVVDPFQAGAGTSHKINA